MSLSPHVLLSTVARERCIAGLKELPSFIRGNQNVKGKAAVLVPLCVHNGEVCLLYTLRSSNLKNHSGQVSFPGGKMDENETEVETALRETHEEIGFNSEDVDIWGKMPMVQGRDKNIVITPVVGFLKNYDVNKLKISPDEVEEVFKVPMHALCNTKMQGHLAFENAYIPVYCYDKYKIWGITGLITHFFLSCFLPQNVYTYDFMIKEYKMDELMPSKL